MLTSISADIMEKLKILSDAAKFDVYIPIEMIFVSQKKKRGI